MAARLNAGALLTLMVAVIGLAVLLMTTSTMRLALVESRLA